MCLGGLLWPQMLHKWDLGWKSWSTSLFLRKMEYSVCHERRTKKNSESPTWSPVTPVGRSNHWATGRLVASEVIFTEFVVTRVLHTARISNVESTVCDNEERLTAVQSPRTTPVKKESDQAFWNWETVWNNMSSMNWPWAGILWYTLYP